MTIESFALSPNFSDDIFTDRFNQIDKVFSTLTGNKPLSDTPPYNLLQLKDNRYQLLVNVPGFNENELEISVQNNQLKIIAKKDSSVKNIEGRKILYQGIHTRNFSLNFNLNQRIKVKHAALLFGQLRLDFEYEIPEEDKAKKIAISVETKK